MGEDDRRRTVSTVSIVRRRCLTGRFFEGPRVRGDKTPSGYALAHRTHVESPIHQEKLFAT
jgi:hypothetical protein